LLINYITRIYIYLDATRNLAKNKKIELILKNKIKIEQCININYEFITKSQLLINSHLFAISHYYQLNHILIFSFSFTTYFHSMNLLIIYDLLMIILLIVFYAIFYDEAHIILFYSLDFFEYFQLIDFILMLPSLMIMVDGLILLELWCIMYN
jgi:hypothetical protein